jgi:hypothetical protein
MNRSDFSRLIAERNALLRMIASTPAGDVLDLGSFNARLEEIVLQLEADRIDEREPARAKLTFNGRPVIGNHGIFADFGMKAVNGFAEAVAAVAASLTAPLQAMGPIPNREQSQLLITSTALGSFGFELEEHQAGELASGETSIVAQALEQTQELLQRTVMADDELLADSAAGLDQRALNKVRAFVGTLADYEAVCAIQINDKVFRFADAGQVRQSLARMSEDNLQEERQVLTGQFEGVLPNRRRTFEFMMHENSEIIVGKIAPAVLNPEVLNDHLHQSCQISVLVTRVGAGRPRYQLLEMPAW